LGIALLVGLEPGHTFAPMACLSGVHRLTVAPVLMLQHCRHTLTDSKNGGSSVSATTRVLENNVIVTTLVCTSKASGACPTTLLLSDTNGNHYGVNQSAGASPENDLVWWRKENLHEALNPAYLGSCDPHMPLHGALPSLSANTP
jgi:hypothetical protein